MIQSENTIAKGMDVLVPKYVFWVDDYPKTASGKIQKFKLREEGMRLLRGGNGQEVMR